jgi:hypothetical protein
MRRLVREAAGAVVLLGRHVRALQLDDWWTLPFARISVVNNKVTDRPSGWGAPGAVGRITDDL